MSVVVALILVSLVTVVLVLGRLALRLGPAWLTPAHQPLWLAAALVSALVHGGARLVVARPAEALSERFSLAAYGPSARVTHLALGLGLLIACFAIVRLAFGLLRRRRLDRAPIPGWFILAGVGPGGALLHALRARIAAGLVAVTLLVTAAGALLPVAVDSTLWASAVAMLVGGVLAFLSPPRRATASASPVAVEPARDDGAAHAAMRAEFLARVARLAPGARPPLVERRPAATGTPTFAPRILEAALRGDAIATGPIGSGKTGAGLVLALRRELDGLSVCWIVRDDAAGALLRARFAAAPEAVLLPPLAVELAARLTPAALAAVDQIVVDDVDRMSSVELAAIRHALVAAPPEARLLVLGELVPEAVEPTARALCGRSLPVVQPRAHEILPTASVERYLVEQLPEGAPTLPDVVVRTLGPDDAHRYLALVPRYRVATSEVLALSPHAARRRKVAPEAPRALAPAPDSELARAALQAALAAGVRDVERLAEGFGRALVERELGGLAAARVPHAVTRAPNDPRHDHPHDLIAVAASGASDLAEGRARTPIQTTRVRIIGRPERSRHRFRGPAELELVAARVELSVTSDGEREHDHAQQRAHTRLGGRTLLPGRVTEARLLVLPTTDAVVLHTLAHVLRDLAPWFFRDAERLIGVTWASAGELGLGASGAIVVFDRHGEGAAAIGAVHDLGPSDWHAWLAAARALLADCDCAAHCARCCESTSCTATPHNVDLDRVRTGLVLERLLEPRQEVA